MINLKDLHFESFRVDSKCTQMLHTTKDYKDVKVDADISTSQIGEKRVYDVQLCIFNKKVQRAKIQGQEFTENLEPIGLLPEIANCKWAPVLIGRRYKGFALESLKLYKEIFENN